MTPIDAVNLAIVALEGADRNPLQEDALVALRHSLKDNWIGGGGPAFPAQADDGYYRGMSLRHYFAGQVMQALVASFRTDAGWNAHENADIAYQIADAMIKAGE